MDRKDVKECSDCGIDLNPDEKNWRFWKYEPDTPLCDSCFDERMDEDEDY